MIVKEWVSVPVPAPTSVWEQSDTCQHHAHGDQKSLAPVLPLYLSETLLFYTVAYAGLAGLLTTGIFPISASSIAIETLDLETYAARSGFTK